MPGNGANGRGRHRDFPTRDGEPRAGGVTLLLALVLLATGSLMGGTARAAHPTAGETHTVIIEGMSFNPAVLIVHRGDRITWVNKDPFPHTVTATSGKFDSHLIAPGGSWTYVARKVGEYDYVCTLHVDMKGRLEVR